MDSIKQWVLVGILVFLSVRLELQAQTEGDTGYNYDDAYIDEYGDEDSGMEPTFDVPLVNVTVVAKQVAVLPCSIDYLGKYKVAWLDQNAIPLTYEDRRVIDDSRFSIVRPYIKEWNLQIRDVQWTDQGQYRCTINTQPIKSKVVTLHVKDDMFSIIPVAPKILDELSSDDTTVQEGDMVMLWCNVTGVPKPEVTWFRRPANSKNSESKRCRGPWAKGQGPEIGMTGEIIIIQNVSRYCDDIYDCVADNGVRPKQSRSMRVTVEFAPEITMPNKRIGQLRGKDTILECIITAYPQANNYWKKDGEEITSSTKYRIEAYDEGDNTLTLSLRIHDIDKSDYGEFECVANNNLGSDTETMYLYEYVKPDEKNSHPIPKPTQWKGVFNPQPPPEDDKKDSKTNNYNHYNENVKNGEPPLTGSRISGSLINKNLSSLSLLSVTALLAVTVTYVTSGRTTV